MCRPICKEEKNEFIGQVIRVFETFLEERNIMSPGESNGSEIESTAKIDGDNYDCIKNNLEMLFYNWKLLEDDRPLIEYLFEVSLNGVKCGGTISVKAVDDSRCLSESPDKMQMDFIKLFQIWTSNMMFYRSKKRDIRSTRYLLRNITLILPDVYGNLRIRKKQWTLLRM